MSYTPKVQGVNGLKSGIDHPFPRLCDVGLRRSPKIFLKVKSAFGSKYFPSTEGSRLVPLFIIATSFAIRWQSYE